MMVSLDLSAARPMAFVSTPSTAIEPSSQSTMRNNTCIKLLLPLPVRPTIPTFSPGLVSTGEERRGMEESLYKRERERTLKREIKEQMERIPPPFNGHMIIPFSINYTL